jgi:hypothetical protein
MQLTFKNEFHVFTSVLSLDRWRNGWTHCLRAYSLVVSQVHTCRNMQLLGQCLEQNNIIAPKKLNKFHTRCVKILIMYI